MNDLLVRWMAPSDKKNVLSISHVFYGDKALTASELEMWRSERGIELEVVVPALHHDAIGYMIYKRKENYIELLDIAGTNNAIKAMLMKLNEKIRLTDGEAIKMMVRETCLKLQNILKANAFRAVSVERGWFCDTNEDAFCFKFDKPDIG